MKLEFKHLAPYAPYELQGIIFYTETDFEKTKLCITDGLNNEADIASWILGSYQVKPILRPLSDLTKEIEVNGQIFKDFSNLLESITKNKWVYFKNEEELHELTYEIDHSGNKYYSIIGLPYYIVQKLLEWHFDVFGLIEQGLAISIHDVGQADA